MLIGNDGVEAGVGSDNVSDGGVRWRWGWQIGKGVGALFTETWSLHAAQGGDGGGVRRDAVVLSWFIGGHEWL